MISLISLLIVSGACLGEKTFFIVPQEPQASSNTLDPAPVAFSFEFPEFPNYFVNISNTYNCIENLYNLTGTWPGIRIGGTTEDESSYNPNLAIPVVAIGNATYSYGPSFLEIAANYSGKVVLGLNRGANNITNTIEAAKAATVKIPNLYAVEFGNEPDIFESLGFAIAPNATNWTLATDAASESQWQIDVGSALQIEIFVQAGNFVLPPPLGYSAETLFAAEDPSAIKYIKDFSHHNYPQTVVNTSAYPGSTSLSSITDEFFPFANLTSLMSHLNITTNVNRFANDTEVTKKLGIDYVFGETNSVSGNGSPVISETFGAAIWTLDYILRAVSINVARLYFHHGAYGSSFYIWWTPYGVTSPYYGGYTATRALAGGSYISPLDDGTTNYAGYVVFSAAKTPLRAVLINTDYFNGTGERKNQDFILTGLNGTVVTATRLTATSALSRQDKGDAPTLGGQIFSNQTCKLYGDRVTEYAQVENGKVNFRLAASEALLVDL